MPATTLSLNFLPPRSLIGVKTMIQLLILALLLGLCHSSNGPNIEREALLFLLKALKDTNNSITDWNPSLVNPCPSWSYVTCQNDHVVALNLASKGFSGTLSPYITKLKYLNNLELQDNNLSGPLPDYIGSLVNLQNLNLARNKLDGSIPDTWGQLSSLKNLDLSSNNLIGTVPPRLFSVPTYDFRGTHLTCNLSVHQPCFASSSFPVSTKKSKAVAGFMIAGGCCCTLLFFMGYLFTYHRRRLLKSRREIFVDVPGEDDQKYSFGQVRRFSWREMQIATDNFSEKNIIGSGGSGKVYKGVLFDGTKVALKRLTGYNSMGGEEPFLREVELISVAVHKNLLRLIGFCSSSTERILVYPFMQNLSVGYRLRELKPGEKGLDWPTRKRVALGTAHGLQYMHSDCNPKIIHRDLKAANILLDDNFEPVLGDFGLAKLVDAKLTHVTTQVRGTMGHIAPEYLSTGKSSEKTDVFGYGITLLELVTGQRAIDLSRLEEEEDVLLLDHMKKILNEKRLRDIVDTNLKVYDEREVEMMVQIALLCTQNRPEDRPRMDEVVSMLGGVGLEERWEEWERMEGQRNHEFMVSTLAHHRFAWGEESMDDQESLQLSTAR